MTPGWVLGLIGMVGTVAAQQSPARDSEEADYEVVVTEHRGPPPREEAAAAEVEAEEAARVPGVQGDAVKAVQTLGGVSRPPAGADGVVVWGTRAEDTRLYVDDVPVPRLFHLGGSRSILPSQAVRSVGLVPGGASARYGRGLGGVVRIRTAEPEDARVGLWGHVDPIDVGTGGHYRFGARPEDADAEGPAGWLAVGARRSVLKRLFEVAAPGGASPLVPLPDYWDYQLRGQVQLTDGQQLSVLALGADDRVDRGIVSLDPEAAFTERTRATFHRVAVRLTRPLPRQGQTDLMLWGGADREVQQLDFGSVDARDDRSVARAGALLSHERRPWVGLRVQVGLDAEVRSTTTLRDGAISLPAREGDIGVFGQPPGNRVNQDRWRVGQAAVGAFATARWTVGPLAVEPGLRVEPMVADGDRVVPVRPTEPPVGISELDVTSDPRLTVSLTPEKRVRLYASGGRYQQPAVAGDRSPVFGTPRLQAARAWHGLAGVVAEPWSWLSVEGVAFWMWQDRLAVRAPLATPAVAALLVAEGQGRSRGVQLSMDAGATGPVQARVAYTLLQADRRASAAAAWRPFDGDQRHGLQALAGWRPRGPLEVGGRFELASGLPRTPVVGAVFNAASQSYDPLFGDHNAERLPTFWALSLQVALAGSAAWGSWKAALDVQNVTDRRNAEEVFYTADYRQRAFVQGLPILPVLRLEVQL
ncbi:MAG: TonB-dependent receptor [Myxococcales bacterium]|nr:TonB-dependent receptor [Myxococcales bacterium]